MIRYPVIWDSVERYLPLLRIKYSQKNKPLIILFKPIEIPFFLTSSDYQYVTKIE